MDGIIIVDKPKNCTSHDIVKKARKILNEKVGHTGTLDPNATGVLPLLIGKGTQISKYIVNHDKIYNAIIQLGVKTETADADGKIIETKDVDEKYFNKKNIEVIFESMIGKQQQIPPIYSAIKVKGKKLYEYARKGESVQIQPRNIEIYELKLINFDKKNKQIEFKIHCSKGTYIRTLCEDIAEKINTVGYMKELKRIQVGEFKIDDAISVEEIGTNKSIITVENFFKKYEKIDLPNKKIKLFLNGVQLSYDLQDGVYRIYCEKNFIGIGTIKNKLLKRDIII